MMALFRAFAKSWVAVILIGFLILAFGIWGVQDVFKRRISDNVLQAGSRSVSSRQFKSIFERQLQQLEQRAGQALTVQDAVAHGVDSALLQQLADAESAQEIIRRSSVQPSDTLVAQQLRDFPVFFNPITGAFDKAQYQQRLATAGLSPKEFQDNLRDQIARDHFVTGLAAGLQVPRTYAAMVATLRQQTRTADYIVVDPKAAGTPTLPTDADLTKLMKQFSEQLRRPELRQITLVRFSAQALAPTVKADPADVLRLFNFSKSKMVTPEKRTFVQIPAKDAGQAAQIAARLGKGEDASAVARAYGAKPVNFADATRESLADPQLANAAFGLQPGKSSGPIQGATGYSVVKLVQITPGAVPSLDAVRPQFEQQARERAAMTLVSDQVQKYDKAHESGADIDKAAAAAGVKTYLVGPFTADGRMPTGQPASGMNEKMVADAFAQSQGGETEIVDLGRGEYYALRVDKVQPSALPSLQEARPQLTAYFIRQQLVERLQTRADALAARLRKGETLAAVAASAGYTVQHAGELTLGNAQQAQQVLGQDFLAKLFQGKVGDVFTARGNAGIDVAKVTAVGPGALPAIVRDTQMLRQQLDQEMLQQELPQLISTASRARVKPKIDTQLARRAIGAADVEVPAASSAKPAAKAQ